MPHDRQAILVATPIPSNADALRGLLEHEHRLQFTSVDEDLFERVKKTLPRLLLLDMEAPEPNAPEFLRRLKADPAVAGVPVLLVCADGASAEAGLAAGAVECLVKPFQPGVVRNRVRICLELDRAKDALRHFSLVDELTGIANRRRFEEFLNMEWRRNHRNQTSLGIILMDLDLFSAYTEAYGLDAADDCLREVASALSALVQRPGDLIARHGRAGFACVLPETDSVGAVSVAERFRAEVIGLAIPHEALGPGGILTVSLGVATAVPMNESEPEDLLALAERHLADAKRTGHNRLIFGS